MWKSVHVRVGVAVFGGVFGGAWALHVALDYRKRKLTITPWDLEDHPAPITDPNLTLKSAQVFFRHGARTPLSHLPKQVEEVTYDPVFLRRTVPHAEAPYEAYNLETSGPRPRAFLDERYQTVTFKGGCHAGMLTSVGREQAFMLGRKLHNKYTALLQLNESFDPSEVYVRSTNVNRTIETLQGVLSGMFGKCNFAEPVRIPVLPLHREFLFPQTRYCKPYSVIYKKVTSMEEDFDSVKAIVEKLNKILGHEGYLNMMSWWNHICIRKAHGRVVPKFMTDHAREIEAGAVRILMSHAGGLEGEALKYSTGPILDMVVQNIHMTTPPNHSNPKLYLFSVHDSTMIPMSVALKIFDNRWPKYCDTLSIELWHDKEAGQDFVKILHRDEEKTPTGLSKSTMSVEEFETLVAPHRMPLSKWHSECEIPETDVIGDYERHPLKIDETTAPKIA